MKVANFVLNILDTNSNGWKATRFVLADFVGEKSHPEVTRYENLLRKERFPFLGTLLDCLVKFGDREDREVYRFFHRHLKRFYGKAVMKIYRRNGPIICDWVCLKIAFEIVMEKVATKNKNNINVGVEMRKRLVRSVNNSLSFWKYEKSPGLSLSGIY